MLEIGETIQNLRIIDADNDERRDIVVETKNGSTVFDFEGNILRQPGNARWRKMSGRR